MDERQTQIREGAGLEESKLNVEFIDWLQKWSTPILMVVAVVALGVVVYKRWQKAKLDEVDRGFGELTSAIDSGTPNPESLKAIAEQYEGVRAIPVLARLEAADEYLRSVRTGMKAGAKVEADGKIPAEDVLTDEDRTRYLGQAETLYRSVLDKSVAGSATAIH